MTGNGLSFFRTVWGRMISILFQIVGVLKFKLIDGAALVEEGGYQFWGGRVRFCYS